MAGERGDRMSIKQDIELALAMNDARTVFALLDESPGVINDQIATGNTFTFLIEACRRRYHDIVVGLIERGADVNRANAVDENGEGGNAPIWFACQGSHEGDKEILLTLITHGADVNARGENGWFPLHMAFQWGHVDLAELLVEKGADVACVDDAGRSPLEWAKGKVDDGVYLVLERLTHAAGK